MLLAAENSLAWPQNRKPRAHLFALALEKIYRAIQESGIADEWTASTASRPEQADNPSCFYRVWIALEFASCNSSGRFSPHQQFGDGVEFAGCTILHLLNQRPLYELWNASQHVINVFEHEQAKAQANKDVYTSHKAGSSGPSSPVSVNQSVGVLDQEMSKKAEAFTAQAIAMRKTSLHIFHILEAARPSQSTKTAFVTAFAPPTFVPPSGNGRKQQPTSAENSQTNELLS